MELDEDGPCKGWMSSRSRPVHWADTVLLLLPWLLQFIQCHCDDCDWCFVNASMHVFVFLEYVAVECWYLSCFREFWFPDKCTMCSHHHFGWGKDVWRVTYRLVARASLYRKWKIPSLCSLDNDEQTFTLCCSSPGKVKLCSTVNISFNSFQAVLSSWGLLLSACWSDTLHAPLSYK